MPQIASTPLLSLLERTPLFDSLARKEVELYAEKAAAKNYTKGQILFLHDDKAEYFFLIERGWVKLFRETLDGAEAVIDILTVNQLFGETSIFNQGHYAYSAEVVEDAVIYLLPLSLLNDHITQNNRLSLNMLQMMSNFRHKQTRELEHRTTQNAPQRIGCFLLQLCRPGAEKMITLHLPYDKMLIAARLGMQPETFSRALSKLQQETGIRIRGASVEIDDITMLTDYSCSACSSSYPCEE